MGFVVGTILAGSIVSIVLLWLPKNRLADIWAFFASSASYMSICETGQDGSSVRKFAVLMAYMRSVGCRPSQRPNNIVA